MGQPYIGEIRLFAGNFAPAGWAFCDGQSMDISQNDALFTLIGTTYGGDGETTFNLPDLRGRVPVHQNTNAGYILGMKAGVEQVTLTNNQIPIHSHALTATNQNADSSLPTNAVFATAAAQAYTAEPPEMLSGASIGPVGGSQPHTNMMPYLAVNFIISLYGIYPSPT